MLQHDSFFFIGVFVFIFIAWIVLGGPSRPLSFSGPLLSGPLSGGTYVTLPKVNSSTGKSAVGTSRAANAPLSSDSPQTGLSYKDKQAVATAIKDAAFGVPSSYRGAVTLNHYVSSAGALKTQNEYVQLSLSSNASGPVTITGWSLTSDVTGVQGVIPRGTEVPRSGIVNATEPIILYPGDRAIISSGFSPIGASFRENVCIGYFAQFQKFSPSLPNSCPTPKSELPLRYGPNLIRDPLCMDYVDSLSRCSLVLTPPTTLSSACQSFLTTHLNYNGCVMTHDRDYNFKGTTWRIYLGRTTHMWRTTRESIKLLDSEGKTVDAFTY